MLIFFLYNNSLTLISSIMEESGVALPRSHLDTARSVIPDNVLIWSVARRSRKQKNGNSNRISKQEKLGTPKGVPSFFWQVAPI